VIIIVITLYVYIFWTIYHHMEKLEEKEKTRAREFQKKIIVYPIIFVALYIFPTINRIYDWLNEYDSFILYLLHGASSASIGFVNSIAYGFDDELQRNWKDWLILHGLCVNLFQEETTVDMKESVSNSMESITLSKSDHEKEK